MDDGGGISITGIAVGGTALTAIGGIVGAWLRTRYGRTEITPTPFVVSGAPVYADAEKNDADHRNLFARVSEHDKDIAYLKATAASTCQQLERMDKKLDTLLMRSKGE